MSTFSAIWIPLYQTRAKIFPLGLLSKSFLIFFPDLFYSEKQLLSMARAILKRSKVLVMDEVSQGYNNVPDLSLMTLHFRPLQGRV